MTPKKKTPQNECEEKKYKITRKKKKKYKIMQ